MRLKKMLSALAVVFCAWMVYEQPEKAGGHVKDGIHTVEKGGHSLTRFFDSVSD